MCFLKLAPFDALQNERLTFKLQGTEDIFMYY